MRRNDLDYQSKSIVSWSSNLKFFLKLLESVAKVGDCSMLADCILAINDD
jgi:glutaredoxin-related protein